MSCMYVATASASGRLSMFVVGNLASQYLHIAYLISPISLQDDFEAKL